MAKASNSKVDAPAASPPSDGRDWEAEDAVRTLTRAEELKADKTMMGRAAKHAGKQSAMMAKIAGPAKQGLISEKQAEKMAAKGR